jgi:potassium efflux system protein
MSIEESLPTLADVTTKHLIFLERVDVQRQLLAIALSLIVGWLLSRRLWAELRKIFPHATDFVWGDERLPRRQYLAALIKHLDLSLISLITLTLSRNLFTLLDWTRGLLSVAIYLLWAFFLYCFFIVSLYAAFPLAKVRQYRFRLFGPLFLLFVLRTIINLYNNLEQLSQITPFKLFNSPVTLRSIFILLVGLYFWVVIVILLEDILLGLLVGSGTQLEIGAIQASLLLVRYFLVALGIVFILGYVGFNITAIAAIAGGLSVGIGFGLQQVVSNFISGILLLFEGILRPGDIISVEGQTCEVKKLGIRATTVRMLIDNSEKIIPNQTFFTSDVTTFTGSDRLVNCSITIGVGYGSNAQIVMDLLLQIANEHPRIFKEPAPSAFFIDFGDSSLNFQLKFWLNDINIRKRIISDLSCTILEKFTEHKIEIPFPQRDIHIREG